MYKRDKKRKLTPEEIRIMREKQFSRVSNRLCTGIELTDSVERLLEKYTKEELDEMLSNANSLPREMYWRLYGVEGMPRRLVKLVTALSRRGGLRNYHAEREEIEEQDLN